jgi:GxxExxY protein
MRDVIAGFYRTFSDFGFGFLEPVYRRALAVELRHAGLDVEKEVAFELFHLGEWIGRYRAELIVQQQLIVEVKTGPSLDSHAIPQLLNYLNVTKLPSVSGCTLDPSPK